MINKFNSALIGCGNIGYERKILNNKWKFKSLSTYHKSNLKKTNSNDKNFEKSYIIIDNISLYKKNYITFEKGYS